MEQQCGVCKYNVICSTAQTNTFKLSISYGLKISHNDILDHNMEIISTLYCIGNDERHYTHRIVYKFQKEKTDFTNNRRFCKKTKVAF